MLKAQKHDMLKPSPFIGQSKKSTSKKSNSHDADSSRGKELAGMNQKQQQKVLTDFENGIYNIIVCTSVAEEVSCLSRYCSDFCTCRSNVFFVLQGLDIGDVDLIVNFDVLKSPIRSIQRSGRTGRKRDGRVVFLVSEGAEERSYEASVNNKKKIGRALKSNKSTFQFCDISPMFPKDPELLRQKMLKADFRLSQVGGHTPKTKGKSKSSRKNKPSCTDWLLTSSQNSERRQMFGELPNVPTDDFDNRRCFPQSLRHNYLKARERSVVTQQYRMGMSLDTNTSSSGGSFNFLKNLERNHIRKSKSLSPLDDAFAKLQSTQKSSTECISLKDDDASMIDSELSMLGSIHCPSFDEDDLVPGNERRDNKDPLEAIFGDSSDIETNAISASQISFFFDSEDHRNCAVAPPPGYKSFVSTDCDSEDNESISMQSKSSQISVNTQNDEMLCAFFDRNRATVATKHSNSIDQPPTETFEDDDADFVGDCTFEPSNPFDADEECHHTDALSNHCKSPNENTGGNNGISNFDIICPAAKSAHAGSQTANDSHSAAKQDGLTPKESIEEPNPASDTTSECSKEKISSTSSFKRDFDATDNSNNSTDNKIVPAFLESALSGQELASNMVRETASNDGGMESIVALQLPTPPDSSDESDGESMGDGASQKICLDETGAMFDTSRITKGVELSEDQGKKGEESSAIFEVEETVDTVHNIQPLQLPTQYSSSSDDESEGDEREDESLGGDTKLAYREADQHRDSVDLHDEDGRNNQEINQDFNKPAVEIQRPPFGFEVDVGHTTADSSFQVENIHEAGTSFEDIVPLQLPTQYSSSSDDDESDDDASQPQVDIAVASANQAQDQAIPTAAQSTSQANDVFIDLCDENDDADSAAKMPPQSSLKNITNFADQDDLVDTPVPKNVNFKTATPNMSPDDLTDTPISERPKLAARSRLSEGLTDTPIKTAEKKKQPKKLAGGRKRLRAAVNDKENQIAAAASDADRQERVKKRIEEKYRCRFLDAEAALEGSGEDSDEEDAIRQMEEDESNSSFINDSSQLGYTQDDLDHLNADEKVREGSIDPEDALLHRQFNHERNVSEQFKTPVFNRRMMRDSLSQSNVPLSQRGLGNMNFIKSVLEHHRQGGDSDEIENEYHRLVGESPNERQDCSPISIADSPVRPAPPQQNIKHQPQSQPSQSTDQPANTYASMPLPSNQPSTLTAEQKAMIEAKRAAALKRRQERMQQEQRQQTAVRANPYAK
jgi:hypothetical protein